MSCGIWLYSRKGEKMIDRLEWRIIELKIRNYPKNKKRYEEYVSDIMSNTGIRGNYKTKREEDNKPQSVTEAAALRMTSKYADRLKKEIEAIELVYNNLPAEEQKIMRLRFWKDTRKNTPYLKMAECHYSERQMKRIVFKIIYQVGKYLGQVE